VLECTFDRDCEFYGRQPNQCLVITNSLEAKECCTALYDTGANMYMGRAMLKVVATAGFI
jgi:hypothetical protein